MEASAQRRRPMAMETSAQANDLNGLNAIGCVSRVSGHAGPQLTCSNLIGLINNINIKLKVIICRSISIFDIYIYFQMYMYSVSGKFLKTQELYIYNWRTVS